MSIRLIYGRAGTGKSTFCFNEIKKKINSDKKLYIITPEQFSFSAEKKLLEIVETNSTINAEVITFKRIAYRILAELGGLYNTQLSICGRSMIIYDILLENKTELKFLGKSNENTEIISNIITELKKHKVPMKNLVTAISDTKDLYLKNKLQDIKIIYEKFENNIKNKFIDEDDILEIISQKIMNSNIFKNCEIYIDEFSGFTKQEYDLIGQIIQLSSRVSFSICTDKVDNSLFYSNNKTINKLIEIAKFTKTTIEKEIYLEKTLKFKNEELAHIEKNLSLYPYEIYQKTPENIEIFLAKNPYSEIEYIAQKIDELVTKHNYRYRDIAIVTKDIDTYKNNVLCILNEYNIPIFIDEKNDLSSNFLIKYVLSIFQIFDKNWSYETVFQYLKSGFNEIEEEDLYELENYCIKWGIRGNKWYKENWKYGALEYNLEKLNNIRKTIIEPLIRFKQNVNELKTVESITKCLYDFLLENKVLDIIDENKIIWNVLIEVLDEIVLSFKDKKSNFEKYYEILKVGFKNKDLGKIPATLDQVLVGDIERSRSANIKVAFIIGVNDGVFPGLYKEEGFLNDTDRENLKKLGIELAITTKERLNEENFNIYKAFTIAGEKIFISYLSSDAEGKSVRPSIFISKIKKIFPKIVEKNDIFIDEQIIINTKFKYEKYDNTPEEISKDNIDQLYGTVLNTSVSKLEQYRNCPFSYFLKYGLKLKEKQTLTVRPIDTGSFMHEVIDAFFKRIDEEEINLREIDIEDLRKRVINIIDEKLSLNKNYILKSSAKYEILSNRLKNVIIKAIEYIVNGITSSEFNVYANEAEFKDNCQYKPISFILDSGKKVEVTGKIDRIDKAYSETGDFIRIIDYKSSIKDIDLDHVMAGIQIQLLTYLDAVVTAEDIMPAGVLYFNILDPIINKGRNLTDEEIEKEIKKSFKMKGLILADVKVVKLMDKNLETGASDIIPVYLKKDGEFWEERSSVITKEEFLNLQKTIQRLLREIANEILTGDISLKPYYLMKNSKKPCDYCEYKTICNFKDGVCGNKYKYI